MVSKLIPAQAMEEVEESIAEQYQEMLAAYYRSKDLIAEPPTEEDCLEALREEKADMEEKLVANDMPEEMAEVYALQSVTASLQLIGMVVPISELMDVAGQQGPPRGPGFQ